MNFLDEKGVYTYDPLYFPSYFFVPKNTTQIQYMVQVNQLKIVTPEGNPVSTTLLSTSAGGDFETRSFVVPPELSGKYWQAIISGNFNYQFLNIPDRYFLLTKK